jgi:large subunit ribosomal protein L13
LLRGKHKTTFTPNQDEGDFVIVINASKVTLTGNKMQDKIDYRHSGQPGGLRATTYERLIETDPRRVIEKAVRGMLPHNRLGRAMIKKLKVYAGPDHPHSAQQPADFQITQVVQ